jgi:hypothetical protein
MKLKLPNAKVTARILQIAAYLSVAIGVCISLHGFWMFCRPAAYIVGGLLLAGAGFFGGLEKKSDDGEGWE